MTEFSNKRLLNPEVRAANSNWSSMDKSPARTYLWSDLASTTLSADINNNYNRLRAMAIAYATPGCSLAGNAALLADITGGLDWMHANRYNPTVSGLGTLTANLENSATP